MDGLIINTNLPSIIVVTLHFLYNLFDDYWDSLNFLRSTNKQKSTSPSTTASNNDDVPSAPLMMQPTASNENGIELLNGMLSALLAQKPDVIRTTTAGVQTDIASETTLATPMNGVDNKKQFSYFQLKYEFIEST
jgi:hypothetical protein